MLPIAAPPSLRVNWRVHESRPPRADENCAGIASKPNGTSYAASELSSSAERRGNNATLVALTEQARASRSHQLKSNLGLTGPPYTGEKAAATVSLQAWVWESLSRS